MCAQAWQTCVSASAQVANNELVLFVLFGLFIMTGNKKLQKENQPCILVTILKCSCIHLVPPRLVL